MAVDLLDTPLRLTWDICPEGSSCLTGDELLQVGQELLAAGLFFATLEGAPLRHPQILPLIEELVQGGCQLAVLTDGSDADLAKLSALPTGVRLFLDAAGAITGAGFQADDLASRLRLVSEKYAQPSLYWLPRSGQLPLLLDLLEFCRAQNLRHFKLPNQKISVNSELPQWEQLPDCEDLEQLARLLADRGLAQFAELQLDVHDLFLWELLQPLCTGQRSEYGGCQAANSLGHIAVNGDLYPCSSWPEPLGNLLQQSLPDLWDGPRRYAIRDEIATVPSGCTDCRDYSICYGGCRGLSRFCRTDHLGRDLLCGGKR